MVDRRTLLKALAALGVTWTLSPRAALAGGGILAKRIPSTGEAIPVIGMGTWITFNVGDDTELRDARAEVLRTFFELGGSVVDSSPMYGSAREVVGYALGKIGRPKHLFSADKIWTSNGDATRADLAESAKLWGLERFDLMQVHNLVAWEEHLPALLALKAAGKVRYVGITTSHGRRHDELEQVMKAQPIDFVQLTYNIVDREAERRLLPLARERGIAVIANRPFQGGDLVRRLKANGKPVPAWAAEFGVVNWPQFLLKFVVSHPAMTCAIPATSKVAHMRENMGACRGDLPDDKARARMIAALP